MTDRLPSKEIPISLAVMTSTDLPTGQVAAALAKHDRREREEVGRESICRGPLRRDPLPVGLHVARPRQTDRAVVDLVVRADGAGEPDRGGGRHFVRCDPFPVRIETAGPAKVVDGRLTHAGDAVGAVVCGDGLDSQQPGKTGPQTSGR